MLIGVGGVQIRLFALAWISPEIQVMHTAFWEQYNSGQMYDHEPNQPGIYNKHKASWPLSAAVATQAKYVNAYNLIICFQFILCKGLC